MKSPQILFLAGVALLRGDVSFGAPILYTIQTEDLQFNRRGCKGPCAVGFEIGYTFGTHDGWARELDGKVRISLDPLIISEAEFTVPASSLTTGKIALRNQHMQETLESEKYPLISFKLNSPITLSDRPRLGIGEEVTVVAQGTWTMHGVSREVSIPLKIKAEKDDATTLRIRANFELDNSAYGIKRYSYLGLTTEDISTIQIDLPMKRSIETP